MEVYHQSATPNVAPYGRVPTIELIRRELCAHAVGTLVETSVRKMARAIGRSAGQLSYHLDQLEADGWIRRLSDHSGTLVEVLRSDQGPDRFAADQLHDRSFRASQSDHAADRSAQPTEPIVTPNPPRELRPLVPATDHADDPPRPPIRKKHDHEQQQQLGAREVLRQRLIAASKKNCPQAAAERVANRVLERNPDLTIAEFEQMCQTAQRRRGLENDGIGLVFHCLQNNEPLYAPKERPHERPRPDAPNRRGRSPSRRVPQPQQPPALTREYLQSRPRRGDSSATGAGHVPKVPGGGPAAGG
jgi:hypothetical protein